MGENRHLFSWLGWVVGAVGSLGPACLPIDEPGECVVGTAGCLCSRDGYCDAGFECRLGHCTASRVNTGMSGSSGRSEVSSMGGLASGGGQSFGTGGAGGSVVAAGFGGVARSGGSPGTAASGIGGQVPSGATGGVSSASGGAVEGASVGTRGKAPTGGSESSGGSGSAGGSPSTGVSSSTGGSVAAGGSTGAGGDVPEGSGGGSVSTLAGTGGMSAPEVPGAAGDISGDAGAWGGTAGLSGGAIVSAWGGDGGASTTGGTRRAGCSEACSEDSTCINARCVLLPCFPYIELTADAARNVQLETRDSRCYRVRIESVSDGSCYNFSDREMLINGVAVDCSGSVGTHGAWEDGYLYIEITAGVYDQAGWGIW